MKKPTNNPAGQCAAVPMAAIPFVGLPPCRAGRSAVRQLLIGACFVITSGFLLTACGKGSKGEPLKPEDVKPVDPNAAAEAQQSQRMKMAVAMRDGVLPPEPTLKLRGGEPATPEVLEAYNQLLLRAMVERREPPESLQEFRKWPLPKLPTPPAGKRIVYDAGNAIIRLDPP